MNEATQLERPLDAAYYVAKYLNKSIADLQWPSNFRRVRTSQKWPEPPDLETWEDQNLEWEYLTTYPSDGLEYLAQGLSEKRQIAVRVI